MSIEYAEMLEIPVSTVNVVRKKNKQKKNFLKEATIDMVNERMEAREEVKEEGPASERTESIRITRKKPSAKWENKVLIAEFAAACLLCATIFLTNVFYPQSAVNTFLRGMLGTQTVQSDDRIYSDFTLSSVVSERADVELAVSSTGVLSFTGEASVYPVCDGAIASVSGSAESGYTVEIKHSDNFKSVISGLTNVYYPQGTSVKGNLPVGYTDGLEAVRVMLYNGTSLLNCYTIDDENLLSWS